MGDMKRQHLISLIFLAAMGIWIGGGLAVCGFTGLCGYSPPSVVIEQALPVGEIYTDEHHDDRYLDWGESPRVRDPAIPRRGVEYTLISVGKGPTFPQVSGEPTC